MEKKPEHEMDTGTATVNIGLTEGPIRVDIEVPSYISLNPKPQTLNSSFHFIFHYPNITPM